MIKRGSTLIILFITSIFWMPLVFAEPETTLERSLGSIGQIILSVGEATATQPDGITRALKRRDDVYENDVITTNKVGHVKIRFIDDTFVSIKPNSEYVINDFKLSDIKEDNKYVTTLVKGGIQVITGNIAKKNQQDFKVNSKLIALSVRGTAFESQILENNQLVGVENGVVRVTNKFGTTLIGEDLPNKYSVSGKNGSLMNYNNSSQAIERSQCRY